MTASKYGYGIVDRHGEPWWTSFGCKDENTAKEMCDNLNDALAPFGPSRRAPYSVVKLVWISKRRRK